jgi:hypothetical protein
MAKFIQISVSGNSDAFKNGNHLLSGDKCVGAAVASGTVISYHLDGGVGSSEATITYTGGATLGIELLKNINYALTANPGGPLAKVQLPKGVTVSGIAIV